MKKMISAFILLLSLFVFLTSCGDQLPDLGEGPGTSASVEQTTEEDTTAVVGGIQRGEDTTNTVFGDLIVPS